MTVVDTGQDLETAPPSNQNPSRSSLHLDLEGALLRLIEQDPFATIREMTIEINSRPGILRATWWQVFSQLRRMKMLTRRSRFKYILGRR
ncbi:MAG: hypothetical protein JSU74_01545 [Candidatus Zixiibacteriota bacterium]|nr:MAG: hypothetical protein JSU74_01545 [candidate division Zixibacteria bacterium]